MTAATYLDSSAIVKLVTAEPESAALRHYLRRRRLRVSSALARTEVRRAVMPDGDVALARATRALAGIELMRLSSHVLDLAGTLLPLELRSLDAVHLATAHRYGDHLRVVVTYDERMAVAAEQLGLRTAAPA